VKRDPVILIVVAVVISLMLVFGIQKTRHASFQPGGVLGFDERRQIRRPNDPASGPRTNSTKMIETAVICPGPRLKNWKGTPVEVFSAGEFVSARPDSARSTSICVRR